MKNTVIMEKLENLSLFIACLENRIKEMLEEVLDIKAYVLKTIESIRGKDD